MAAKKRKIRKIKKQPPAISNSYTLEKPDFSLFARPSFLKININGKIGLGYGSDALKGVKEVFLSEPLDWSDYYSIFPNTKDAFVPPNPKELLMAIFTFFFRATLGT
jgi:hypothetical protein